METNVQSRRTLEPKSVCFCAKRGNHRETDNPHKHTFVDGLLTTSRSRQQNYVIRAAHHTVRSTTAISKVRLAVKRPSCGSQTESPQSKVLRSTRVQPDRRHTNQFKACQIQGFARHPEARNRFGPKIKRGNQARFSK